jgi:hypothetical protein
MSGHSAVSQAQSARTAVCVLRVESRSEAGILITITTTPDIRFTSPGLTRSVATTADALSLVATFLEECEVSEILGNGAS